MSVLVHLGLVLAAWLLAAAPAQAGHEFPFYPSFYPHEITIETVDPASAVERIQKGSLHAYVGGDPFEGKPAPPNVGHVEFLGGYVVVTFNPASPTFTDGQRRCAVARQAAGALRSGAYIAHPYPVTPYHGDYLHHIDLVEAAKKELQGHATTSPSGQPLRLRPRGTVAEQLVPPGARADDGTWDVAVEVVDTRNLLASGFSLNGWMGPPWIKEGWFHAYLVHADTVSSQAVRQAIEAAFRRLVTGNYDGSIARLNLERKLVSLLRSGCERTVAGYIPTRERFNAEYSGGVENIAYDAHTGFHSAVFLRTVKLKDFPWNGWLTLGIPTKPGAAWNPVGGLSDPAGRLIWFALGDPALFSSPWSASWVPNRVTATLESTGRGVAVPPDALLPEAGTGLLRNVAAGTRARARVQYRVLTSAFHDGTRMSVTDLLYPFIFSYRWGTKGGQRGYDPTVDAATALLRERLAGLKVLRVEADVLAFGDVKLTYEVPVVDVYVNHDSPDPLEVAALAPPWSSVPWHVTALMEEAVARGLAAFSPEEARRRGIAWMDLARDKKLKAALATIVDEFARQSHVPVGLRGSVTAIEARDRWSALQHFYDTYGHFLVTNGPYRLHQ